MISTKELLLITFFITPTSCVSIPIANTEYWESLVSGEQFQNEKKIYQERWSNKTHCWEQGVSYYLTEASLPPCSKLRIPYLQIGYSIYSGKKVTGQKLKQPKVMQKTPGGFLVTNANLSNDKLIFIKRTDEVNIVDGSFLDEVCGMTLKNRFRCLLMYMI